MGEAQAVYVDHAATTPVRREVLEAMLPYFSEQWGNPSSLHALGRRARRATEAARAQVAEVLGCGPDEVVFTGSGSEGANLAIKGAAFVARGERRRIVTSQVEHQAVLETCRWLERHFGFVVEYVGVDADGVVDLGALERAVDARTALVSIMYANNEVGTVEPIQEAARIAHAHGALFHTDAVQAAGALPLNVAELGVDLLSLAGHKIYGPKGSGALYVRRGTRLLPQMQGGGQERGRRSGTENVPYVVGLAQALGLAQAEREASAREFGQMSGKVLEQLPALVPGCRVTGHPTRRLPGHASVAFEGVEIESVLLGLDRLDIWASSGSACTSASSEPSHVLQALGLPRAYLYGALRMTFGRANAPSDADLLLKALPPLVAAARGGDAVGSATTIPTAA